MRELDPLIAAELDKANINVQAFVHFAFDSGDLRLWTGIGEIPAAGVQWIGGGDVISISPVSENAEVVAEKVDFGVSGISTDIISIALGEHYQGRNCELFLGFFNNENALIDDIFTIYKGRLDIMEIDISKEKMDIVVRSESRLRDLKIAPITRLTDQDQQNKFPGDKFLEFVPMMQEKRLVWGRA